MSARRTNRKSQKEEMATPVDIDILKAFEDIVDKQFEKRFTFINAILENTNKKIDETLAKVSAMQASVFELERAAADVSMRVETVERTSLPALAAHVATVTTNLASYTMDLDVHRRKWSLLIQGLKDAEGEDDHTTRTKCITLAKDKLRILDAADTHFLACHRLSRKADAGIILRFVDLSQRNRWLMNARHLKTANMNENISISPDLPPVIRPLKTDLLQQRKALPPDIRAKAHIQYISAWPYVKLTVPGQPPRVPSQQKDSVMAKVFGVNALMKQ